MFQDDRICLIVGILSQLRKKLLFLQREYVRTAQRLQVRREPVVVPAVGPLSKGGFSFTRAFGRSCSGLSGQTE